MAKELPRITMRVVVDDQLEIQVRYLVIVKGTPWAFAQPEDAALDPLRAKALLLDPSQILEEYDSAIGKSVYRYRTVYHARR